MPKSGKKARVASEREERKRKSARLVVACRSGGGGAAAGDVPMLDVADDLAMLPMEEESR